MLTNETKNRSWGGTVRLADSFFKRFRGLMLVGNVSYALVFVLPAETRANASIHTFFMLDDIDVIWLDSSRRVVDFKRARKWRLYVPKNPARYIIEGPVGVIRTLDVSEGDLISWQASEEKKKAVPLKIGMPDKISFDPSNGIAMTESVREVKVKGR
ncbi:DUF192 domain-containing protein [Thermococcus celer]|uniref:UPF0127 protein A3L02_02120 n=1 Tax=Thermococcus celer Vu 13 = JCM 8558 TaxID=1293037 RepID=A0A218P0J6_THECE|nr:DUF192 domain-containing protein [Thermococcus celer]ASI98445.1 hypothetical protein A3L02_02120 [Thermococcus celer Vu 13 = JCM 8558]